MECLSSVLAPKSWYFGHVNFNSHTTPKKYSASLLPCLSSPFAVPFRELPTFKRSPIRVTVAAAAAATEVIATDNPALSKSTPKKVLFFPLLVVLRNLYFYELYMLMGIKF